MRGKVGRVMTMDTRSDLLTFPVRIEVDSPERFERIQVVLRVVVFLALATFFQSGAGLWALTYLALPLVAALLIERHGSTGYLERDAPRLLGVFEWLAGFCAYMLFVTDRLPLSAQERPLRLRVRVGGVPNVRSALGRLLTSLPHFVLIALVSVVSALIACIAAACVLWNERYSAGLRSFQQEIVAWIARLLVYHASFVEAFPPLSLERTATAKPAEPLQPIEPLGGA